MLKKLISTVLGKKLANLLKLKDDTQETAPVAGQPLTKVPWYESKTKLSVIVAVLLIAIEKLSGPVFNHPVVIPNEVIRLLELIGLYGLRDALKRPA